MTNTTDIINMNVEDQTAKQIKEEERKQKLKEYRRNYYRDYYKRNPEKKDHILEIKASNNRKRYEQDEEYRKKQIEYSRFYRQLKKKEKEEINERLAKLDILENLINNKIDFKNTNLSVKV